MERQHIDYTEHEVLGAGLWKWRLLLVEIVKKSITEKLQITPNSEKPSSPDVKGANSSLSEMNRTIGRNLLANAFHHIGVVRLQESHEN
jgi:hypothetical protein